jgi:rhamnogalacturonyl hydrolase YesR
MGLLDQADYANSEISGSGFFTYGLAWGIHNHILDANTYMPVVKKAWAGMLTHVYANGRLGAIQPIGAAPGEFAPSASYVYGVGAFELAGAELDRLAGGRAKVGGRGARQGRRAPARGGSATPTAR